ncbi:hypothetical protein MWU60_18015 [Yoonia sp. F2084L]|uniref:hypothetical protein n=1 Tax=Yoonia sp. F2084L TaxID=2926419 RepID=UPI001FF35581|nr:hypothetical protein [Yoonia sp. F2084L]MCK0097478.1 hypothetical protein [Yoonia sp. F2084L]
MLLFAGSLWHIAAGLLLFLAGLSVAIAQKRIFCIPQKRAIALYLWHSFFCIFYFWYSLNNSADSAQYYIRSLDHDSGFRFGTHGVYHFLSFFTQVLKLSYGNLFLLFNIIGYIGLLSFASALQIVTERSHRQVRKFSIAFIYLPGMSFWSSAIGKDAITFMAAGLATWAALDISRRAPVIALSALLFLVPRPHMAGIFLLSFCLALLISSRVGIYKKIALLAVAVPLSAFGVQFALSYVGLGEASNLSAINDLFETRQGYNLGGGSSVDIAAMSVPMRMFTYLFRPLLFDAGGILGLVVSLENLLLLGLLLAVILRKRRTRSALGRFEFVFFLLFVLASWFVLANSTANLGIAIRQKTMFLPMLIVLLFSLWQDRPKQPIANKR